MVQLIGVVIAGVGALGLKRWYKREVTTEAEGMIHWQREHEHLHLHVDLPPGLEIEAGDTLDILTPIQHQGETQGEISYPSRVRLRKASWLKRTLIQRSSLIEVKELVDHP